MDEEAIPPVSGEIMCAEFRVATLAYLLARCDGGGDDMEVKNNFQFYRSHRLEVIRNGKKNRGIHIGYAIYCTLYGDDGTRSSG